METSTNLPEMKVLTAKELPGAFKSIKAGTTFVFDNKSTRDSAHTIASVLRRVTGNGLTLSTRAIANGQYSGQMIQDMRER